MARVLHTTPRRRSARRESVGGRTGAGEPADGRDAGAAMARVTAGRKGGPDFPIAAGIFFGLGIGGFFDGIVLHQILQWHHMVSAVYPPDTVANLRINTLGDGLFHASTYLFVLIGLVLLWRQAGRAHIRWANKLLIGALLIGFGTFNVVEGLIDHQILGVHHVNETVPRTQWVYWDLGFLLWGAAMIVGGWALLRAGQRQTARAAR